MKNVIDRFFKSYGIEYYAVLSYRDCKEINPGIMTREDFIPKSVIVYLLPYLTIGSERSLGFGDFISWII